MGHSGRPSHPDAEGQPCSGASPRPDRTRLPQGHTCAPPPLMLRARHPPRKLRRTNACTGIPVSGPAAGEPSLGHEPRVTASPQPEQCCRMTRHEATALCKSPRWLPSTCDVTSTSVPDFRHHNAPSQHTPHLAFLLPREAPFLWLGGFFPGPFTPLRTTPSPLFSVPPAFSLLIPQCPAMNLNSAHPRPFCR